MGGEVVAANAGAPRARVEKQRSSSCRGFLRICALSAGPAGSLPILRGRLGNNVVSIQDNSVPMGFCWHRC